METASKPITGLISLLIPQRGLCHGPLTLSGVSEKILNLIIILRC